MKTTVVIGLIGTVLDKKKSVSRWNKWRPTVSIFTQEDLQVDRMELLGEARFARIMDRVTKDIKVVSPNTVVNTHHYESLNPWDFQEMYGALYDFAKAYPFDPENEEYLIHITTGTHVAQICLFLLAESKIIPGKLLQTSPRRSEEGPHLGSYDIIDLDLSRYDQIASRFKLALESDLSYLKSGIETRNERFNRTIEQIERVAIYSQAPLLITGPTGAGKSHLARQIFNLKRERAQVRGQFVEVNCATLRGDGAMSSLFGHRRGAFTGALADRPGLLKTAHGGILFLDEVGELGLDEQAMLLRALEEKRFMPVGADKETTSEFQLICGTNRDLAGLVASGRFREDLLCRINLWSFELPGLAQRPEDIEPNLDYELQQYERTSGRHISFNKSARERFLAFAVSGEALWRGNFRDLNGAMVRMATFAEGGRINVALVDDEIARLRALWHRESGPSPLEGLLDEEVLSRMDLFDRLQLEQVVAVCRSTKNAAEAGRKLFAVSRLKKQGRPNDSDRLRKYLLSMGLTFRQITTTI